MSDETRNDAPGTEAPSPETSGAETLSSEISGSEASSTVILAPRYFVPTGVAVLGLLGFGLSPWLTALVVVFAVFLAIQAATLRLHFTTTDLEVWRGSQPIRTFPYADWQSWTVFWPPLPILFYFKEVNSIHFLPMLFDARALNDQLNTHVPTALPDSVQ